MSFIDRRKYIFTEKSGNIKFINLNEKKKKCNLIIFEFLKMVKEDY